MLTGDIAAATEVPADPLPEGGVLATAAPRPAATGLAGRLDQRRAKVASLTAWTCRPPRRLLHQLLRRRGRRVALAASVAVAERRVGLSAARRGGAGGTAGASLHQGD